MNFDESDFDFEKDFRPKPAEKPVPERGHELGLFPGISNAEYHGGAGISSSQLKYAAKALRLYKASISGELPKPDSDAMALGTAVHALVLEPDDFDNQVAVFRKPDLRTKVGKQIRDQFYAANTGKTIITVEEFEKAQRMRDSIMALPDAMEILEQGVPELSGYYLDKTEHGAGTHMLCKYRPDTRTEWCIADIKTTRDASKEGFPRIIHNLGYHISAAHYLAGDAALRGTDHRQFIFLCVEPEPPHLAATYVLGEKSLELGEKIRRKALDEIKKSRKTGVWAGLNGDEAKIIDVPNWAFYEMDSFDNRPQSEDFDKESNPYPFPSE